MPQFDFTTYSSQIFWFSLCFATLYFVMYKIVIPRILHIIEERKHVIDADRAAAQQLDTNINALREKTENLRREASEKYQAQIDSAVKDATKARDKTIEELKEKFEALTKKSRHEFHDLLEKSQAKNEATIQSLTQTIKAKILS